jgi:hypothetical protein
MGYRQIFGVKGILKLNFWHPYLWKNKIKEIYNKRKSEIQSSILKANMLPKTCVKAFWNSVA